MPGTIVSCSVEGTRPMLVEIQALVSRTSFGIPRRTAVGVDYNRVNLLMAVMEKRARMDLSMCDAYINIAGGIRMNEPAVDLGIVLAMASCFKNLTVTEDTASFGEVGLAGEVRAVRNAEQRIGELQKMGFKHIILPKANMKNLKTRQDICLYPVNDIGSAVAALKKISEGGRPA